jgi:hypothetical protein
LSEPSGNESTTKSSSSSGFSLRALLYWTTLLALGMGTFGPWLGIGTTVAVALLHSMLFIKAKKKWLNILLILVVVFVLIALMLPAVQVTRASSRRATSLNNIKQLSLGLVNYDTTLGSLPPHASRDTNGTLLHSWRTIALPFYEQEPLFKTIDRKSPWDSFANNAVYPGVPLSDVEIETFQSPLEAEGVKSPADTSYFAVVGDETLWPETGSASLEDIPDGPENTILLIEAVGRGVRWCEPRDLTIDEAVDLLAEGSLREKGSWQTWVDRGFFLSVRYKSDGIFARSVAFADGSVRILYPLGDRELARALLTRNGGEPINQSEVDGFSNVPDAAILERITHWENIIPTALYAVLAIAPIFQGTWRRG